VLSLNDLLFYSPVNWLNPPIDSLAAGWTAAQQGRNWKQQISAHTRTKTLCFWLSDRTFRRHHAIGGFIVKHGKKQQPVHAKFWLGPVLKNPWWYFIIVVIHQLHFFPAKSIQALPVLLVYIGRYKDGHVTKIAIANWMSIFWIINEYYNICNIFETYCKTSIKFIIIIIIYLLLLTCSQLNEYSRPSLF